MANYNTLKSAIEDAINTNGTNAITGAILQQTLLSLINSLGSGYQYVGVATPETNPGTPDQRIFYIAGSPGEYTNFGPVTVSKLSVLYYDSSWHLAETGVEFSEGVASALRFYAEDYECFQMYGTDKDDRVFSGQMMESAVFRSFLSLKLLGFEDGTYMLELVRRYQGTDYRFIWDKLVDGSWVRYADFRIQSNVEVITGGVNVFDKTLDDGKRMVAVIDFSYYKTYSVSANMPTPACWVVKSSCLFPDGDYLYGEPEKYIKDTDLTIGILSDNIANPNLIQTGKLIASNGNIASIAGWAMIGIPVSPGQQITAGGFNLRRTGYYAFYNDDTMVSFSVFDNPNGTQNPLIVTVPVGANILYIDIKTDESGSEYNNLMINYGATLKPYDQYREAITEIKEIPLVGESTGGGSLSEIIADLPVSDGSTIDSGYAYIDSTDRTVKVKS